MKEALELVFKKCMSAIEFWRVTFIPVFCRLTNIPDISENTNYFYLQDKETKVQMERLNDSLKVTSIQKNKMRMKYTQPNFQTKGLSIFSLLFSFLSNYLSDIGQINKSLCSLTISFIYVFLLKSLLMTTDYDGRQMFCPLI